MSRVGSQARDVRPSLPRDVRQSSRFLRRIAHTGAAGLTLGLAATSCSGTVEEGAKPCGPNVSSTIIQERVSQGGVRRIDVLLAVDNSRSMADKQQILALAVPDLVQGLVNPACINPITGVVDSVPASPLDACPPGTARAFEPVLDIHIGIVSSSLGGHGSDACQSNIAGKESSNDKGHLIARKDPAVPGDVETYQNLKFLAWDPAQKLTPPGEADVQADTAADANSTALVPTLREMVLGVGQIGCGYESQLESWYRFLVDPTPPESITLDSNKNVVLMGTDQVLLDQRKSFLRPDSLLAIVMLTDENDCSIKETGQFYYVAQQKGANNGPFHLPKARAVCDADPNDQCCFSCGQKGPVDDDGNPACPVDPTCTTADGKAAYHDDLTDNINLRCWDQKRRFGIDFLYPVERYVNALQVNTIADRTGQIVPNPLFTDLDPSDAISDVRTRDLILFAGIVGVPWQDVARTNDKGVPDLVGGLDADGNPRGGFKTPDEMSALLPGKDYTTWDLVLGDPLDYPDVAALPRDPLMLETWQMRTGANPITGDPVVSASTPLGNKINGHEWSIPKRDDLQYACIFPLVKVDAQGNVTPDVRDCSTTGLPSCDCEDNGNDNPLCEVNPSTGEPTDQVRAKAYPGVRHLQALRGMGSQAIVASVCPAQLVSPQAADFGYRPAVAAILDRLRTKAVGKCFGHTLTPDAEGRVDCVVVEARSGQGSCDCSVAGRVPVAPDHEGAVTAIQQENPGTSFDCFCEIPQIENAAAPSGAAECKANYDQSGYDLCACQYTPLQVPVVAGGAPVDGWCYVDPQAGVGNASIVEACPSDDRRLLRFVGAGAASSGAALFVSCNLETVHDPDPECGQ